MSVNARVAVIAPGERELTVADVVLDDPGPREVLVEQFSSGVCHSQLDLIDRTRTEPIVLGHESVGTVITVGREVTAVGAGDTVMITWLPRDPTARTPTPARVPLPDGSVAVTHNVFTWGTHALADEQFVVKAPQGTPPEVGSIIGCAVMTGAGAVLNSAPVERGESVAVWGAGGLGLAAIAAARNAGASTVIAVDINDAKLDLARTLGAHEVVNATTEDAVARVREIAQRTASSDGVDIAFDFTGRGDNLARSLSSVRAGVPGLQRGGRAVIVGAPRTPFELTSPALLHSERQLIGSLGGSCHPDRDFPVFVDWYRTGRLDLDSLVTNRYSLDQVNDAVADLRSGKVLGRAIFDFQA